MASTDPSRFTRYVDEKSGRVYIHDANTGETKWDLPPDEWICLTDKASGRFFWYNQLTKKSQWENPAFRIVGEEDQLRDGSLSLGKVLKCEPLTENVKAFVDPTTGRQYWYNAVTRTSTWVRPNTNSDDSSKDNTAGARKKRSATVSLGVHSESQWEKFWDPDTQRAFFFHRQLGISQWERPVELGTWSPPSKDALRKAQTSTSINNNPPSTQETEISSSNKSTEAPIRDVDGNQKEFASVTPSKEINKPNNAEAVPVPILRSASNASNVTRESENGRDLPETSNGGRTAARPQVQAQSRIDEEKRFPTPDIADQGDTRDSKRLSQPLTTNRESSVDSVTTGRALPLSARSMSSGSPSITTRAESGGLRKPYEYASMTTKIGEPKPIDAEASVAREKEVPSVSEEPLLRKKQDDQIGILKGKSVETVGYDAPEAHVETPTPFVARETVLLGSFGDRSPSKSKNEQPSVPLNGPRPHENRVPAEEEEILISGDLYERVAVPNARPEWRRRFFWLTLSGILHCGPSSKVRDSAHIDVRDVATIKEEAKDVEFSLIGSLGVTLATLRAKSDDDFRLWVGHLSELVLNTTTKLDDDEETVAGKLAEEESGTQYQYSPVIRSRKAKGNMQRENRDNEQPRTEEHDTSSTFVEIRHQLEKFEPHDGDAPSKMADRSAGPGGIDTAKAQPKPGHQTADTRYENQSRYVRHLFANNNAQVDEGSESAVKVPGRNANDEDDQKGGMESFGEINSRRPVVLKGAKIQWKSARESVQTDEDMFEPGFVAPNVRQTSHLSPDTDKSRSTMTTTVSTSPHWSSPPRNRGQKEEQDSPNSLTSRSTITKELQQQHSPAHSSSMYSDMTPLSLTKKVTGRNQIERVVEEEENDLFDEGTVLSRIFNQNQPVLAAFLTIQEDFRKINYQMHELKLQTLAMRWNRSSASPNAFKSTELKPSRSNDADNEQLALYARLWHTLRKYPEAICSIGARQKTTESRRLFAMTLATSLLDPCSVPSSTCLKQVVAHATGSSFERPLCDAIASYREYREFGKALCGPLYQPQKVALGASNTHTDSDVSPSVEDVLTYMSESLQTYCPMMIRIYGRAFFTSLITTTVTTTMGKVKDESLARELMEVIENRSAPKFELDIRDVFADPALGASSQSLRDEELQGRFVGLERWTCCVCSRFELFSLHMAISKFPYALPDDVNACVKNLGAPKPLSVSTTANHPYVLLEYRDAEDIKRHADHDFLAYIESRLQGRSESITEADVSEEKALLHQILTTMETARLEMPLFKASIDRVHKFQKEFIREKQMLEKGIRVLEPRFVFDPRTVASSSPNTSSALNEPSRAAPPPPPPPSRYSLTPMRGPSSFITSPGRSSLNGSIDGGRNHWDRRSVESERIERRRMHSADYHRTPRYSTGTAGSLSPSRSSTTDTAASRAKVRRPASTGTTPKPWVYPGTEKSHHI